MDAARSAGGARRRAPVRLAVAALAVAVLLSGCEAWSDDAVGDGEWLSRATGSPRPEHRAHTDVVHAGVDVGHEEVRLVVRVLATAPPPFEVAVEWHVEGVGADDHVVVLERTDREVRWRVHTTGSPPRCEGDGRFTGGEYAAVVPMPCLGHPTAVRVSAGARPRGVVGTPGWYDWASPVTPWAVPS